MSSEGSPIAAGRDTDWRINDFDASTDHSVSPAQRHAEYETSPAPVYSGISDADLEKLIDLLPTSDEESSYGRDESSLTMHQILASRPETDNDRSTSSPPKPTAPHAPILAPSAQQGQRILHHHTNRAAGHSTRPTFTATPLLPISPHLVGKDLPSSSVSPLQLSPHTHVVATRSNLRKSRVSQPGSPLAAQSHLEPSATQGFTAAAGNDKDEENLLHFDLPPEEVNLPNTSTINASPDQNQTEKAALIHVVTSAQAQVSRLRSQIEELRPLVREAEPDLYTERIEARLAMGVHAAEGEGVTARLSIPPNRTPATGSPRGPIPEAIAQLSGDEARQLLSDVLRSLNLPLSAITSLPSPPQSTPSIPPIQSVTSITSALTFLTRVDELVWRRSTYGRPAGVDEDVFGEENVRALTERVELWERAVRTRK